MGSEHVGLPRRRARKGARAKRPCPTANPWTKNLDLRGLVSNILSILRGGIPRSVGNLQEMLSQKFEDSQVRELTVGGLIYIYIYVYIYIYSICVCMYVGR